MPESRPHGIYLFVDFDWPRPFETEHGKLARKLHDLVQDKTWIREAVAASGGIGGPLSSSWVFWLESYAALDRLLQDKENEVALAYSAFFSQMATVEARVRAEVHFL